MDTEVCHKTSERREQEDTAMMSKTHLTFPSMPAEFDSILDLEAGTDDERWFRNNHLGGRGLGWDPRSKLCQTLAGGGAAPEQGLTYTTTVISDVYLKNNTTKQCTVRSEIKQL